MKFSIQATWRNYWFIFNGELCYLFTSTFISDSNLQNKTGKFPCSVCLKGVGGNSILCPACKCWVHAKCSGLKGQLTKATNFVCSQCSSGAVADRNNEGKSDASWIQPGSGRQILLSGWYVRSWWWRRIKHCHKSKKWVEKVQRTHTTANHQGNFVES